MIDTLIGFVLGLFVGGFAVVMMIAIIVYRIINSENLKEEQ